MLLLMMASSGLIDCNPPRDRADPLCEVLHYKLLDGIIVYCIIVSDFFYKSISLEQKVKPV